MRYEGKGNVKTQLPIEEIQRYLEQSVNHRPLSTYCEERLNAIDIFSDGERWRLMALAQQKDSHYRLSVLQRFLIDLTWASSALEGNSYTYLDTQALIEYGARNPEKPSEDAVMIINHKRAIEMLLKTRQMNTESMLAIHRALSSNAGAEGSRHFLEPHQSGHFRTYEELDITGSAYIPPQGADRAPGFIEQEFGRLIETSMCLNSPLDQSLYLLTRIPYLQPFCDANKRLSRLACNIPLIGNGLAPLTFVDFDKSRYLQGLLSFYELGDERLMKDAFMDAYITSSLRYSPLNEKLRVAIGADIKAYVDDAKRYVMEGVESGRIEDYLRVIDRSKTENPGVSIR